MIWVLTCSRNPVGYGSSFKLRDVVVPRASEEARELFKTGQKPGSLARQHQESVLSYVSRRRWWNLLKTLDESIELSEPMRVELLLELSGLGRSLGQPNPEHRLLILINRNQSYSIDIGLVRFY